MRRHSRVRAIVVYASRSGEKNSRVGLYTETGLMYATAYGGRSLTGSIRGSDMLFTMGRFALEKGKTNMFKIYDVQVYNHCYELSKSLPCYYATCVCVEAIQYFHGVSSSAQFKVVVDLLLYLLSCSTSSCQNVSSYAYAL